MSRRIVAVLVAGLFVLVVAGCSTTLAPKVVAPTGKPVTLLTGAMPFDADECSSQYPPAVVLPDPKYGTAFARDYGYPPAPIMWPPGYTARVVGDQTVVVDPDGYVVAKSGESYLLPGNILIADPNRAWPNRDDTKYRRGWVNSLIGPDMFYACGPASPTPTNTPLPMI